LSHGTECNFISKAYGTFSRHCLIGSPTKSTVFFATMTVDRHEKMTIKKSVRVSKGFSTAMTTIESVRV
jgi:hypothetical protein